MFLYPQYATSGAPSRKATHSSVGVTVPDFGFLVFVIVHVIGLVRSHSDTDGWPARPCDNLVALLRHTIATS